MRREVWFEVIVFEALFDLLLQWAQTLAERVRIVLGFMVKCASVRVQWSKAVTV